MQFQVVITFLITLSASANAQVVSRWFNTHLDHFNPLVQRFFDIRYLVNNEHYNSGGPIYIYVPGGEVYDEFLTQGAVFEVARDTNGLLLALEHRYFGESRPTDNLSVDNLAFLSLHQAVADIGDFIEFIKLNYQGTANSRVVLWGRGCITQNCSLQFF